MPVRNRSDASRSRSHRRRLRLSGAVRRVRRCSRSAITPPSRMVAGGDSTMARSSSSWTAANSGTSSIRAARWGAAEGSTSDLMAGSSAMARRRRARSRGGADCRAMAGDDALHVANLFQAIPNALLLIALQQGGHRVLTIQDCSGAAHGAFSQRRSPPPAHGRAGAVHQGEQGVASPPSARRSISKLRRLCGSSCRKAPRLMRSMRSM